MPKSKKKKQKHQDFQKVKLKVGKKLPRGQNETVATFQSRTIHIPEQLQTDTSQPTTRKKLNIQDLFSQCQHYNISVRHEAVSGLRELLQANPEMITSHLSEILEQVSSLLLDKDYAVRAAVIRLLKSIFPSVSPSEISPFFPVLSAHLCCAMTHIDDDIQVDSLSVLDICLEHYPTQVTGDRSLIMTNFIELISRQSQVKKGGKGKSGESRNLLVNPSSKLSSQKWRQKVLDRVQGFLKALMEENLDMLSKESKSYETVYFQNDKETNYLPFNKENQLSCCLGQGFQLRQGPTVNSSSADISTQGAGQNVEKFLQTLVPLLLQIWMEMGPAHFFSDIPGNALSPESMATLVSVVGILQSLLQLVESKSGDLDQNHLSEVVQHYKHDVLQQFLPSFPYCMHERIKQGKKKDEKGETPQISILSLNLEVCQVMTYFDPHLAPVTDFLCQTMTSSKMNSDQLSCVLKIVNRLLRNQKDKDSAAKLLNSALILYQRRNAQTKDKLLLLNFFADITLLNKIQHIENCPALSTWLASLPHLLVQTANCGHDRVKQLLHVIRTAAAQGQKQLLEQLQIEFAIMLDPDKMNITGWEASSHQTLFELLMWVRRISKAVLTSIVRLSHIGTLSPQTVAYLLQILIYRFEKHENDNIMCPTLAPSDFISFLFSLIIGHGKDDFIPLTEANESNDSSPPVQIKTEVDLAIWESKIAISKSACETCCLLQRGDQVQSIISSHVISLFEGTKSFPFVAAYNILQWTSIISQSSQESPCEPKLLTHTASLLLSLSSSTQMPLTGDNKKLPDKAVALFWKLISDLFTNCSGVADAVVALTFETQYMPDVETVKSHLVLIQKMLQIHTECGGCLSLQSLTQLSGGLKHLEKNFPELTKEQLWTAIKYSLSLHEKSDSHVI